MARKFGQTDSKIGHASDEFFLAELQKCRAIVDAARLARRRLFIGRLLAFWCGLGLMVYGLVAAIYGG